MKEYLYIDKKRINRYAELIEGDPYKFIGSAKIGGELSFTPKIKTERAEILRELTTIEKVELINTFIEKNKLYEPQRPSGDHKGKSFVWERCRAIRVTVPWQPYNNRKTPEFCFWYSFTNDETRPESEGGTTSAEACLMEDFLDDKGVFESYGNASTYTLLQSLVHYARTKADRNLDKAVPYFSHKNPYIDYSQRTDSYKEYTSVNESSRASDFIKNPYKLFKEWGAMVSPARDIDVLYRVREFGRDAVHNWQKATTFGYPLWIVSQ